VGVTTMLFERMSSAIDIIGCILFERAPPLSMSYCSNEPVRVCLRLIICPDEFLPFAPSPE
jgi:hypothetical protein